ncbi:hypothetical protein ABL78_4550 [Leptomonas seymouri]|uniref:Uncharacterized protein n=1 Tax=Leptomonas seymouri TaxID=5684 RepID=A0A0N0P5F4_LEPSE|nr:hypothetical protein ABL78_4550 [Leptomonas seymouri]|eukprot:KPI86399.1 hypothetical protein ABL78_4550 [Leptomonas seymouri]
MSTTSREGHRPPLTSSTTGGGGGIVSLPLTPTAHSSHRPSPSSSKHALHHTPPSSMAAPVLTPSAASVSATLWAFRNASAAPSPVGSAVPPTTPIPRVEGTTPEAARPPLSSTSTAAAATTSDDILRGIYNEKLHASVRSIITTLSIELPADHIFLQLLADPSTQQYCKVRMAEVVEGFLYSTQAEQYHELATELARREQDCEMQRQRIEELETALGLAVHEAQQQRKQHERGVDEDGSHTSRSPPTPLFHDPLSDAAVEPSSPAPPPARPPNPMEDEEARRELLRVLEQATHDQELSRCRQALQAVTKVVAVTSEESTYEDKYLYEGELMDELYKCVHSLLMYVDGALDSQERLRWEILGQHPWIQLGREAEELPSTLPAAAAGGGTGGLVASDYSTPHRPRVSIGGTVHNDGSVFGSAVSSHLQSTSASGRPPLTAVSNATSNLHGGSHGVSEIQKRREELQQLAQKLRSGHLASRSVLEQLARGVAQHRREVAQLQRALEAARNEAAVAAVTADGARHAKESVERLRAESVASAAAESAELREKLADVRAQLAVAAADVEAARHEVQILTPQLRDSEKREAELLEQLSSVKAALLKKEALLREQQAERVVSQAALTELKAAHQVNVDALQDAARELLCLRVEKTMTGLSSLYHEAKATKADLLEREGYRHLCNVYSTAAAAQHEAARHALMQLQATETAQLEKAMTQQSVADALGLLLRSMWADDATEAALGNSAAEYDAANSDGQHEHLPVTQGSTTASEVSHKEGATGTSALHRSQKYRLPTTLSGLCSALDYAYADVRARHRARQKTIESLRTTLIGKDIELRAAQANEAQLRDLLKAERAKEEQWRAEVAQLSDNNPMRDLLVRQDALLKAVSEERNALRRQWNSLSGDYIVLEQRNGVLHARCAEKEHENARLSGMLLRNATASSSTSLPSKSVDAGGTAGAATDQPQPTLDKRNSTPGGRLSFSAKLSTSERPEALSEANKGSDEAA